MLFSAIGFLFGFRVRLRSIDIPNFLRIDPSNFDSAAKVCRPGAQSTWTVVPFSGISSNTVEIIPSLRESAVSSGINLVDVNCDNFSRHMKINCPSFLMTSAAKFYPKVGVTVVDSPNSSLGNCWSDLQRSQFDTISLIILVCPEQ